MTGCGTFVHQYRIDLDHNGRADLTDPYAGAQMDLYFIREAVEPPFDIAKALPAPFFALDLPLNVAGDTLFIPRWAVMKTIHKDEEPPLWFVREQERADENKSHALRDQDRSDAP